MERKEVRDFKDRVPKDLRRAKAQSLMAQHPGKYPLVLVKDSKSRIAFKVSQYMVNGELTICNFLYSLRRSINMPKNRGLYLFLSEIMPMLNSKIAELYERFADDDGFLYFSYSDQEDKG